MRCDLLVSAFEDDCYGGWTATGEGFGSGPLRSDTEGRFVFDAEVSPPRLIIGAEGRGIAASVFKDGRPAKGAGRGILTSTAFTIARNYLNLKLGGGWYPGRTCVDLIVDGRVIRSEHGLGFGYGEHDGDFVLEWFSWNVRAHQGASARIRLVDDFEFFDGCILVDRVVQSDEPKAPAVRLTPFHESYRPRFHFTAARGWMQDPCGLFFHDGFYHLIYYHAMSGQLSCLFEPAAWGHAVSTDLLHWRHLPNAIRSEEQFDWSGCSCWGVASAEHAGPSGWISSGSTVVDVDNDSGLQEGEQPPILSFFTYNGDKIRGQCLAFSTDGGWNWRTYAGNPLLPGPGVPDRDPKVFKQDGRWYMAVSHAWGPGVKRSRHTVHLYTSDTPTRWTHLGEIPSSVNFCECPDLFAMPVGGEKGNVKWVLVAGDGKHLIGRFEGGMFHAEAGPFPGDHGHHHYATQTWFDGRRRIQIAWMISNRAFRGMPFNQQLTFPRLLELKTTPAGVRMYKTPIPEIESLRISSHSWQDLRLAPGSIDPFAGTTGESFDIVIEFEPGASGQLALKVDRIPVLYDAGERQVRCLGCTMPLAPVDGRVRLRVLVDQLSIELFGNDGEATLTAYLPPPEGNRTLAIAASGEACTIVSAEIHELRPAWPRPFRAGTGFTLHSQDYWGAIRVACVGSASSRQAGYPAELAGLMGEGWEVRSFVAEGATVLWTGTRPFWKSDRLDDALAFQPYAVVIDLGSEDVAGAIWTDRGAFSWDYREIVELFAVLPTRPLIWACLPGSLRSDSVLGREIVTAIEEIAGDAGLGVVHLPATEDAAAIDASIHRALTGGEP